MAPAKTKWAPMSETTSLSRRSSATAPNLPSSSPTTPDAATRPWATGATPLAFTRATRKAEHSSAPAATRKIVPGPDTPSSTPARAGPPNTLRLSIQPAATLAAVSSSGVLASYGSNAPCVGLVSVRLRDTRATRA
jgi:hypothetical protein